MHRLGCLSSVAHREDNSSTATHNITTGEDRRDSRLHAVVDHNRSFLADLQALYGRWNERVRTHADRYDYEVNRKSHGFAFYGYRTATTALIGFA